MKILEELRLPIPFNMGENPINHPILSIGSSYSALRDKVYDWLEIHAPCGWRFGYDNNAYCLWFRNSNDMDLFTKTYLYGAPENKINPFEELIQEITKAKNALEQLRINMDMAYLDSMYAKSGFAFFESRYLSAREVYYDALIKQLDRKGVLQTLETKELHVSHNPWVN